MLTDQEARTLLHQAADTIEVGPSLPFPAPPRRPALTVLVAAAAAVLVVVSGLLIWHSTRPEPATPPGSIRMPSVFGYDVASARRMLRDAGLEPRVEVRITCAETDGKAIGTEPTAGTALAPGTRVTLFGASNGDGLCLGAEARARADAWNLVDTATGHGTGARFAPYVSMTTSTVSPVTVPADPIGGPNRWLACGPADAGCPGTVLDVLRRAAAQTAQVDGRTVSPELVVGTNPQPWHFSSTAARSIRFLIDLPKPGPRRPTWSVNAYYDARGRVMGVELDWGRTYAADPAPAQGAVGVGPDPQGIGARFLAWADDTSRPGRLPIDTPVRLYLDNVLVRTITSQQAAHASGWRVCPGFSRACPESALFAAGMLDFRPDGAQLSTSIPASRPCLRTSGAPTDTGGTQVEVLDGGPPQTCRDTYEVQLYSNDAGQLVAVNLLTPVPGS